MFMWVLLCIGLVVFVIPFSTDILIRIIAGYVLYLFAKDLLAKRVEKMEEMDKHIDELSSRISRVPRRQSRFVYSQPTGTKNPQSGNGDAKKFM